MDAATTAGFFVLHPLADMGAALPADSDHPVARLGAGALLLIHVPPGDYAFEVHRAPEYIVCLQGRLAMEAGDGSGCTVPAGSMVEVPAGLRHRFGAASSAVVLTVAQSAARPQDAA